MNSPIIYFAHLRTSLTQDQLRPNSNTFRNPIEILQANVDRDECRTFHQASLEDQKLSEIIQSSEASTLSIVHLAGEGIKFSGFYFEGEAFSAEKLAKLLADPKVLHLVILEGEVTQKLYAELAANQLPFLLVPSSTDSNSIDQFYQILSQGYSISVAYDEVRGESDVLAEITYYTSSDFADQANLAVGYGLYIPEAKRNYTHWKIPKKFVIPIDTRSTAKKKKYSFSSRPSLPSIGKIQRPAKKFSFPKGELKLPKRLALPSIKVPSLPSFSFSEFQNLFSLNPKTAKRMAFLLVVSALLGLGFYIDFSGQLSGFWNSKPEKSIETYANYKIVIIPLHASRSCSEISTTYGNDIQKNIVEISNSYQLSLLANIQNSAPCPIDPSIARDLLEDNEADLIIWGSYDPYSLEGKVQLLSSNAFDEEIFLPDSMHIEAGNYIPTNFAIPIRNAAHWFLGKKAFASGLYIEAVSQFSSIETENDYAFMVVKENLIDALINSQQYEEAINLLTDLLTKAPEDADLLRKRASLFSYTGNADLALSDLAKAQAINPEAPENLVVLADIQFSQGAFEEAKSSLKQVIEKDEGHTKAYIQLAQVLSKTANYEEGIQFIDEAISLNPDAINPYLEKAKILIAAKDKEGALKSLAFIEGKYPDDERILMARAHIHTSTLSYDQALVVYQQALDLNPRSTDAYLGRADLFIDLKKYEEAINDLNALILINPKQKLAHLKRASLYEINGLYDQALSDYDHLIGLYPEDAKIYALRGSAAGQSGDRAGALSDYEKALDLNLHLPDVYFQRALLFLEEQKFDDALTDIEQVLANNSRDARAYIYRGKILLASGAETSAAEDFDYALQLAPNSIDALYQRGMLKFQQNRFKDAINDLQQVLAIKPTHRTVMMTLAKSYLETSQHDQAQVQYESLLKLGEDDMEINKALSELYIRRQAYTEALGILEKLEENYERKYELLALRAEASIGLKMYERALQDINDAIEIAPDSISYYCLRANVYVYNREYELAKNDYLIAIDLDPLSSKARLGLGMALARQGAMDDAIQQFNLAEEIAPQNAEVFFERANFYMMMKNKEFAKRDYDKCLRLNPYFAEAYNQRGKLQRSLGKYNLALNDFGYAISLQPNLAEPYYNRGFLLGMQGKFEEAVEDLKVSIRLDSTSGIRYGTLAKIYARQRKDQLVYKTIESALERKYPVVEIRYDPAFAPYREEDKFKLLLESYKLN